MTGIYFSGTGNSKYCIEKFLQEYDAGAKAFSIENEEQLTGIQRHEELVFSYPVQFSCVPTMVRDFVVQHGTLWQGRRVFVIATMGLFSGDGAGVLARMLRRYGAAITGGLHLKMPDSISDEKALKRTLEENRRLVENAGKKPPMQRGGCGPEGPRRRVWGHFIIWRACSDKDFTFLTGQNIIRIN